MAGDAQKAEAADLEVSALAVEGWRLLWFV
jgi:hypothetical protein